MLENLCHRAIGLPRKLGGGLGRRFFLPSLPARGWSLLFCLGLLLLSGFAMFGVAEWNTHGGLIVGGILVVAVLLLSAMFTVLLVQYQSRPIRSATVQWLLLIFVSMRIFVPDNPAARVALFLSSVIFVLFNLSPLAQRRVRSRITPRNRQRRMVVLIVGFALYFIPLANVMADHTLLRQFISSAERNAPRWVLHRDIYYDINEHDFRGPSFDCSRPTGDPRLLFLGDSSTFGFDVTAGQTYALVAEKILREKGLRQVRALNAGVNGYGILGVIYRYRQFRRWNPSFVFIMDGAHCNDFAVNAQGRRWPFSQTLRGLSWVIAFFRPRDELASPSSSFQIWRSKLAELTAEILKDGRIPVLIDYPSPAIKDRVHDAIRALADDRTIYFLNANARFSSLRKNMWFFDQLHPNKEGHLYLGCLVAQWVAEREGAQFPPVLCERLVR